MIVPNGGKNVRVSQGHALVHVNKSGLYSRCLWRRRWSSFQGKRTAVGRPLWEAEVTRAQRDAGVGWLVNLSHAMNVYSYSDRSVLWPKGDPKRSDCMSGIVIALEDQSATMRLFTQDRAGVVNHVRMNVKASSTPMLFDELQQENEPPAGGGVALAPQPLGMPFPETFGETRFWCPQMR